MAIVTWRRRKENGIGESNRRETAQETGVTWENVAGHVPGACNAQTHQNHHCNG